MHNPNKNICIAGIGNTLRSDDSVGIYICNWLKKHEAPATILTTHQLDITMAETLSLFDVVIFIDAAVNESSWSFTLWKTIRANYLLLYMVLVQQCWQHLLNNYLLPALNFMYAL